MRENPKLESLKTRFFKNEVMCLAKIVPNVRRDQDTIIFELMIPDDVDFEDKIQTTYQILTPFLLTSNHVFINL